MHICHKILLEFHRPAIAGFILYLHQNRNFHSQASLSKVQKYEDFHEEIPKAANLKTISSVYENGGKRAQEMTYKLSLDKLRAGDVIMMHVVSICTQLVLLTGQVICTGKSSLCLVPYNGLKGTVSRCINSKLL